MFFLKNAFSADLNSYREFLSQRWAKKVIFSFHSDFSIIVNSDKFAYER